MSKELDDLRAAVTKIEGAADSAIALVKGFATYVAEHVNDPTALANFADEIVTKANALGDAVASNPVPATPTPAPTPAPVMAAASQAHTHARRH